MKKIEWINGNKMLIETGHATFDRQTNVISTGNIIANTMVGWNIRSWYDDGKGLIDYDTNKRTPGVLFRYDTSKFNLPSYVLEKIMSFAKDRKYLRGMWLYQIHHFNGRKLIVHGWILTDFQHNWLTTIENRWNYKSHCVLNECRNYLSN